MATNEGVAVVVGEEGLAELDPSLVVTQTERPETPPPPLELLPFSNRDVIPDQQNYLTPEYEYRVSLFEDNYRRYLRDPLFESKQQRYTILTERRREKEKEREKEKKKSAAATTTEENKQQEEEKQEQEIPLPEIEDCDEYLRRIPVGAVEEVWSLGCDVFRRNNLHHLDSVTMLYAAGNRVHVVDTRTNNVTLIHGLDGGGIGAIAVHPGRTHFAVAEKGHFPNVYVYAYPSLALVRVLRRGTERAYSALAFSHTGKFLASVGSAPDFMLTVWNWEDEAVMLRSKAFAQEVYNVAFSPENEGRLTTSGTGHVRFWKMASTFTGLKLQGEIGKFGVIELTDIISFVEFPDGKILSGTESGHLLLWEGNLVKAQFGGPEGEHCHNGPITFVCKEGKDIVTAGHDGYIRVWEFDKIDTAESFGDESLVRLTPTEQVKIGDDVHIRSISRDGKRWLIQDESGAIWEVELPTFKSRKVCSLHSGAINAVDCSPKEHLVASAGSDSSVRVYDYSSKTHISYRAWPTDGGATSLAFLPEDIDQLGLSMVVGFHSGVVRILKIATNGELVIEHTYKPHTAAITCASYSPDRHTLATASLDGTVFFVNVQDSYTPIAFSNLNAPVNHISWRPQSYTRERFGNRAMLLLASLANGTVVEANVEGIDENVDTTKSFEVKLQSRVWTFNPPINENDSMSANKDGDLAETVAHPVMRAIHYGSDGTFIITVGGDSEDVRGKIFKAHLDEPDYPTEIVPSHPGLTVSLRYSLSGKLLLSGGSAGTVRIHGSGDDTQFWENIMHDRDNGAVLDMAASFDDNFIFSVGKDNGFFIYRLTPSAAHTALAVVSAPVKSRAINFYQLNADLNKDIVDPTEYSIEQAKLKKEFDKKVATAELKKSTVRAAIDDIRAAFLKLKERNNAAEGSEKLTKEDLVMYPELDEALAAENIEKVEQAKREMTWHSEKRRVALRKWKRAYLDDLEMEGIALRCLKEKYCVRSFRLLQLPESIRSTLDEVNRIVQRAKEEGPLDTDDESETDREGGNARRGGAGDGGKSVALAPQPPPGGKAKSAHGRRAISSSAGSQINKVEAQRLRRQQRKDQWDQFKLTKPAENFAHPEDLEAIWYAENHLGDYKLKSDPNYIVPEAQRVDEEKKRRQIVLLEESRHEMIKEFNRRLFDLRALKIEILKSIREDTEKINEIDAVISNLPVQEVPESAFRMNPEEMPENRYVVDDAAIAEFAKELERREAAALTQKADKGRFVGGFGGFSHVSADANNTGSVASPRGAPDNSKDLDNRRREEETAAAVRAAQAQQQRRQQAIDTASRNPNRTADLSELEKMERKMLVQRKTFEKERLQKRIAEMTNSFDEAVNELRIQRFRLASDLKTTDLKLLVLEKELVLLAALGKDEAVLVKKHQAKMAEKSEIVSKIVSCQERLQAKQEELMQLQQGDEALRAQFGSIVGDQNPFFDALSKIFKKKIKRNKKKAAAVEKNDDDDDDDDGDDDDDMDDLDEEDDDEDEEMCPPGCNPDIYNQVIDLREKRMDQQEQLAEFQRSIETLVKENEALVKKEKVIDAALRQIDKESQQFQSEKQRALNELDVVISLKMEQVETTDAENKPCLPAPVTNMDEVGTLVFTHRGIHRLQERIKELILENRNERKRIKTLKADLAKLGKDQEEKKEKIQELTAKVTEIQLLKFGQEIDLELLEKLSVNRIAEDMKAVLAKEDHAREVDLERWDQRIRMARIELANVTAHNSKLLERLLDLSNQQQRLENKIGATSSGLNMEDDITPVRILETKKNLLNVLSVQAQEIESLKTQVSLLRGKTGNLFSITS